MNDNKNVVETLNEFLKGIYMGIHAYEKYIHKVEDSQLKQVFQEIQINHKEHASKVAKRIQDLKGTPADDEGLVGSLQGSFAQLMIPDKSEEILAYAIEKEDHYAVHVAEQVVKGELDAESNRLIKGILDEDREHVNTLKQLSLPAN